MGLQLLKDRVRQVRRSNAELRLTGLLASAVLGTRCFRRAYPIGPFIIDFVCVEESLAIELLSDQHVLGLPADTRRKWLLESMGYRVLRLWDSEVLSDPQAALKKVLAGLKPSPGRDSCRQSPGP